MDTALPERSRSTLGDVTGEYLAIRREAGVFTAGRQVVSVRGVDAHSFLEGIVSQDVAGQEPGAVVRSLLLAPQGKLRSVFWMAVGDDHVSLITDPGLGDTTLSDLARYRIRVDAELSLESQPLWEIMGPGAEPVVDALVWPSERAYSWDDVAFRARVPLQHLPRFFVAGIDEERAVAAGARPVGLDAASAVRVEAGEPLMGVDIDERTIPQESGLVPTSVSFAKGCYLGQELVARIDSRGHVNRRLVGLRVEENTLPPAGASVVFEGKEVGSISSPVESLELRAPLALGLIRREVRVADTVALVFENREIPATVVDLPFDDFTQS